MVPGPHGKRCCCRRPVSCWRNPLVVRHCPLAAAPVCVCVCVCVHSPPPVCVCVCVCGWVGGWVGVCIYTRAMWRDSGSLWAPTLQLRDLVSVGVADSSSSSPAACAWAPLSLAGNSSATVCNARSTSEFDRVPHFAYASSGSLQLIRCSLSSLRGASACPALRRPASPSFWVPDILAAPAFQACIHAVLDMNPAFMKCSHERYVHLRTEGIPP